MEKFSFVDREGVKIAAYKWATEGQAKGVIQIVHGMAEYALRYEYFAKKLTEAGYIVYAHDHRGHGASAISEELKGFIGENDGFEWLVKDVKQLTDIIKEENPGLPVIVFGHSMGSFVTQRFMQDYGTEVDGIILSGTNGKPLIYTKAGIAVSKLEMMLKGKKAKCPLMDKLSFGDFNSSFKPNRTPADWVCSNEEEVDKYIADPECGFVCATSFYYELVKATWRIHEKENMNKISKDLPIYIMAGDKDPVGNFGKGIVDLYNRYMALNIKDVKYKLYKDGRHEMLNETNRDEVITDILGWCNNLVNSKVKVH